MPYGINVKNCAVETTESPDTAKSRSFVQTVNSRSNARASRSTSSGSRSAIRCAPSSRLDPNSSAGTIRIGTAYSTRSIRSNRSPLRAASTGRYSNVSSKVWGVVNSSKSGRITSRAAAPPMAIESSTLASTASRTPFLLPFVEIVQDLHLRNAPSLPLLPNLVRSHFHWDNSQNWVIELRIASHEVFDRYFHFATPQGDLSQAELEEVLELAPGYEALAMKFRDLKSRGLLDVLLDRLDSYKDELPLEHAVPVVTALLDLDVDADDEVFSAHVSPQTHIRRIIHWYLRREPDETRRKQVLLQAISASTGLASPAHVADRLKSSVSETQLADPDALLQKHEDIKEVCDAVTTKIRIAATAGRLTQEQQLPFLLRVWDHWSGGEESRTWVLELVQFPSGILRFLEIVRRTTRSYGGSIPKDSHYYNLSDVEHFVPTNELLEKVQSIGAIDIKDEDAKNISRFQKAIERRNGGQPDLNFMNFDEDD